MGDKGMTVARENKNHGSRLEGRHERRALSLIGAFVSGAALILISSCTAKLGSPVLLAPSLTRFLKGDETYTASIKCHPSDEVLIRVTQDNIDVTLTIVDGVGGGAAKVDAPSGRFGDEFLVFTCGPQSHRDILIQSQAKSVPGGNISVAFYSLAGANKSMAAAFRHMSEAGEKNVVRGDGVWASVLSDLSVAGESWQTMGMRREYALSEFEMAYVHYMDLSEWRDAARHADMAVHAFAEIGDKAGEAAAKQLQGAALEEVAAAITGKATESEKQRAFEESEALLQSAEKEQQIQGRLFDVAMSRDYLALNYYYRGRQDAAITEFGNAERDFATLNEVTARRMVLQNSATISYENGSYGRAKGTFEALLLIMTKEDDPYLYATVLHNSALVLSVTGDLQTALEREIQSLEIQKARNSRPGQARSLYAIGIVYQRLGNFDRALEYLKSALALQQQEITASSADKARLTNQRGQIFATLVGIGNVDRALGENSTALSVHADARQYAASDKSLARIELALGLDYASMGKVDLALQNFDRAQNRGPHDSNPYFVEIVVARSKALRGIGKSAASLGLVQEAARIAVANDNLREQAMISAEIVSLKAALRDREGALKEIARAIALSEHLRINTRSPELRAAITASQRGIYREWVNLLLWNAQAPGGSPIPQDTVLNALAVADRSHDRALLEQLHYKEATTPPRARTSDEQRVFDELAGKRTTLDALLERDTVDAERTSKLRNEIAFLQAKADVANQTDGLTRDDIDARVVDASSLQALQSKIPAGCTLLEYMLTADSSWVWAVHGSNDVALYRLPSEERINTLVQNMRKTLQTPISGPDWRQATSALADAVLKPALAGSLRGCLVVVPDGTLHYVPFSLLGRRLYPKDLLAATSIAPSLKVLQEVRINVPPVRPRVAIFTTHPIDNRGPSAEPRLQSVDAEVRAIQVAFGTDDTYVATPTEATRSGIMRFDFNGYSIVHIATHGSIDATNGALSRLSFGNSDDVTADLRAYDISSLRLGSQVVVLSACDSGLGQFVDGEGLVGFVDAFIGAGAESVLMSLWKVPDEATAQLMGAFYRELKHGRVPPAEALAAAQSEMESSGRWSEPYYWAGFELVSTRLPFEAQGQEVVRRHW
jgi:CHAT domain-containing protein/tetratricopeptide (TPR) repeat protein